MSSFDRFLTATASTTRIGAMVDGVRSGRATSVASLACTPLDPADPGARAELIKRLGLNSNVILLETFCAAADIERGDHLVVGSTEYPIRSVADWTWRNTRYLHLHVEEVEA